MRTLFLLVIILTSCKSLPVYQGWPECTLTYSIDDSLKAEGLTKGTVIELTKAAAQEWSAKTDITLVYVEGVGNIVVGSDQLPPWILGRVSRFPDTGVNIIYITTNVKWVTPWNKDIFKKMMLHEIGHALGLRHSNSNRSIMYASIWSENDGKLHQFDINRLNEMYKDVLQEDDE